MCFAIARAAKKNLARLTPRLVSVSNDAGLDYRPLGGAWIVDRLVELVEVAQRLLHRAPVDQLPDFVAVQRVNLRSLFEEKGEGLRVRSRLHAVPTKQPAAHVGEMQRLVGRRVSRIHCP